MASCSSSDDFDASLAESDDDGGDVVRDSQGDSVVAVNVDGDSQDGNVVVKDESIVIADDDESNNVSGVSRRPPRSPSPASVPSPSSSTGSSPSTSVAPTPDGRCPHCDQKTFALCPEFTSADRATREMNALKTEGLQVLDVEEEDKPTALLTDFYVYDANGHLVDLASRLIESGKELFFTGRLFPAFHDGSLDDDDGGVKVVRGGPIQQWWTHEKQIGITTEKADYYLRSPAKEYTWIFESLVDKNLLTTSVQSIVSESMEAGEDLKYEDLVDRLATRDNSTDSDDYLLEHAVTVLSFIWEYDQAADDDEPLQLTSCSALKTLAELVGYTFKKRSKQSRQRPRMGFMAGRKRKSGVVPTASMATTTPLVKDIFEGFFKDQLKKEPGQGKAKEWRQRRCGACANCLKPDCGRCGGCHKMSKFSGKEQVGRATCLKRPCLSDSQQDVMIVDEVDSAESSSKPLKLSKAKVAFDEDDRDGHRPDAAFGKVEFFTKATLTMSGRSVTVAPGDFVTVQPDTPGTPHFVAQLLSLTRDPVDGGVAHVRWMCRSVDTILGDDSEDENELFDLGTCEDIPLDSVSGKQTVDLVTAPNDWNMRGGTESDAQSWQQTPTSMFFRFTYDPATARFTAVNADDFGDAVYETSLGNGCPLCKRAAEIRADARPRVEEVLDKEAGTYQTLMFKGERYEVGDACFVDPSSEVIKMPFEDQAANYREDMEMERRRKLKEKKTPERTEFYRINPNNRPLGYGDDLPAPFRVCVIEQIRLVERDRSGRAIDMVCLKLRTMFRPEDVDLRHLSPRQRRLCDVNEVFWSNKKKHADALNLMGKVELLPKELARPSLEEWKGGGSNRFVISKLYSTSGGLSELPSELVDNYRARVDTRNDSEMEMSLRRPPLRSLEVFAGCGGLSEGLRQSGAARAEWAIEFHEPAAEAFKRNHKGCQVFTEDCNKVLSAIMKGKEDLGGKRLPKKGEVEIMSGGPPCQGYSLLNAFSEGEYSQLKNSQVASYLAYADYFRPKFFLMENVRNFASFKKGLILKLCLRALVRMGYQCTFGILQAGNYGVPQSRRRCFLLAAAPDQVLPRFPEPRHIFPNKSSTLLHIADERLFTNGQVWTRSAPYRATTIADALSDMPSLDEARKKSAVVDDYLARVDLTPFQRQMRRGVKVEADCKHLDHEVKTERPLIQARMEAVPTDVVGADWRLLPNEVIALSDGTKTSTLDYRFRTKEGVKGVCLCQDVTREKKQKSSASRDDRNRRCTYDLKYKGPQQERTLIPWRLPHTGDFHNHWAGLYGRLAWEGFFTTMVTQATPESKQGWVIHPQEHRVVSVRECARSQGFPDDYVFAGTIKDKYRQIGNAVPPPLAKAIGIEIVKSIT